ATATALAAGTSALAMLLAVLLWIATNRAATARAVNADLDEAVSLQNSADWARANAALERARLRLGDRGPQNLRARLGQVGQDAELVTQLDAIRISHAFNKGDVLKFEDADRDYEAAFRQLGLSAGAPDVVGARVHQSHIHLALIDALYDWSLCATDKGRIEWLREVAAGEDRDPTGWRAKALGPGAVKSQHDVEALASDPSMDKQPVSLQLVVVEVVAGAHLDPSPLLLRAQRSHPNDFWVNLAMGDEGWRTTNYPEAIRYFQAAAAVRPDAALGFFELGLVLAAAGRPLEAIDEYREALRVGGDSAVVRVNLATACALAGRHEDACREFDLAMKQIARKQVPQTALYEGAYAYSLMMAGHDADALKWAGRATSMEPQLAVKPTPAQAVFLHARRWDEILASWHRLLEEGADHEAWRGYAELAIFSGDMAEYRRACQEQLERFGKVNDPTVCEGIGRACLLADPPEDVLRAATALVDRTLASERRQRTWRYPYFMFAKGLAELRAGRAESARAIVEGPAATALGPAPKLVAALAHARLGQAKPALLSLAAGELAFNWSPLQADSREAWMYHVLRREAERAILPQLPRFLAGQYEPQDDMERLAMCGECQFRELHAARARLLRQVIGAHPELATQLRAFAVISAALAGCGEGRDIPALDDTEREHWRSQARDWVREELTVATPGDAEPAEPATAAARAALAAWLAAPELARVRDPAALSRLPDTERREWTALWAKARTVAPASPPVPNRQ
ncbi:MAG TPA: tetratricopeptide repeat protein, partial [Tepidisphaeraceae bacterium]